MKKMRSLILAVFVASICSSCTSAYWLDRGRDSLDVFTATAGFGGGAGARVGPFGTGLGVNLCTFGVKDGVLLPNEECLWDENGGDLGLVIASGSLSSSHPIVKDRRKQAQSSHFMTILIPVSSKYEDKAYSPSYFTQIEAYAGFGTTFKLGFNPGELLDLILGFCGVDIYGDDVGDWGRRTAAQRKKDEYLAALRSFPVNNPVATAHMARSLPVADETVRDKIDYLFRDADCLSIPVIMDDSLAGRIVPGWDGRGKPVATEEIELLSLHMSLVVICQDLKLSYTVTERGVIITDAIE